MSRWSPQITTPCRPAVFALEHHQVADAGLVESSIVVDDEHVAGRGVLERLEEDVHAAAVARGKHPTGAPAAWHGGTDGCGSAAHRNARTRTGIGQMGGRQSGEPLAEFVAIHASSSFVVRAPDGRSDSGLRGTGSAHTHGRDGERGFPEPIRLDWFADGSN
ncbi:hypothetical protein GCM10023317_89680 [Actinopolymorpha pittospori]